MKASRIMRRLQDLDKGGSNSANGVKKIESANAPGQAGAPFVL